MSAATIWFRNGILGLAALGFLKFSSSVIGDYLHRDPFEAFRQPDNIELEARVAIRLEGVSMRHYKGAELIATANADRMDQWKDAQTYDLYGVKNGKFQRDKKSYTFSASHAQYYSPLKRLDLQADGAVGGKDFELRTEKATFDGMAEVLTIRKPLSGKVSGGDFTAATFDYNLKTEMLQATMISWKGDPGEDAPKKQGQVERTAWKFDAETLETSKTDKDVKIYTNGQATDGEIIVRAPRLEQNKRTDVLIATGGVTYFSGEANVSCQKATIYRKEKRAVLDGKVLMLVKPKARKDDPPKIVEIPPFKPVVPDDIKITRPADPKSDAEEQKRIDEKIRSSKNLRDYPMTVFSEKIEYWYGKGSRRAIITGSPQAHQEFEDGTWRQLWADRADYDGEKETMFLQSLKPESREVRMKNSIGDDFIAFSILASTKEDDETISAKSMKGVMYTIDDEIDRDKKKKPPLPDKKVPPPTKGGGLNGPIKGGL